MKLKTTFFLLAAAAACAWYVFFFEHSRRPAEAGDADGRRIFEFAPGEIERFSVAAPGRAMECIREKDEWILTSPVRARADFAAVEAALDALAFSPVYEIITPSEMRIRDLAPESFGLGENAAEIKIFAGVEQFTLRLGGESPLADARYVQKAGVPGVIVTAPQIGCVLKKDPADWRDRRVLHGDAASTVKLEIKVRGRPPVFLARDGDAWRLQKPFETKADAARITELLSALYASEAVYFQLEAMADPVVYGFGEEEMPLQLGVWRARDPAGVFLRFGREVPDMPELVYANFRGMSTVMAADKNLLARFNVAAAELRDRLLWALEPDAVKSVTVRRNGIAQSAERDAAGLWKPAPPAAGAADETAVKEIISRFGRLEAARFLPEPVSQQHGLETDSAVLFLELATQSGARHGLRLGDPTPEGTHVYAVLEGQADVFLLNIELAALLRGADIIR